MTEAVQQIEDVDAYLAQLEEPTPERPMSAPEETAAPEQTAAPQTPPPEGPKYEFDWNGKKIVGDHEKWSKWASQGYDYSQRMEQFKKQQAELEAKYKPYDKYKTIDDYVQKDPAWWQHVEESWNNRLATEDPTVQRVKAMLDEKLQPFQELIAQRDQEAQQKQISEEDTALAQDIKSIREKYSDLDFDTPDAEGKSLEDRVIAHGVQHGFKSYTSAFRDFYHDQLELRAEARGREAVAKDAQKRAKLGLSATPQTPRKSVTDDFDLTGKTHNQILEDIVERLGL